MIFFLVLFLIALLGLVIFMGLRVREIRLGRIVAPEAGEAPEDIEDALPFNKLHAYLRTESMKLGRKLMMMILKRSMRTTALMHRLFDKGLAKVYKAFVHEHAKLVEVEHKQSTFLKKIGEYKEHLKHHSHNHKNDI
jgi:hypothetical protein